MADKEIVIKISEENYELAQRFCKGTVILDEFLKPKVGRIITTRLMKAIGNGTPLEKHDEEIIKETVESIWGKPPYIEHIDNLIDKCMETLFDVTLDKIATELKDLIKTVDDMGCSTKQFRVALGIVNQYRKGADK